MLVPCELLGCTLSHAVTKYIDSRSKVMRAMRPTTKHNYDITVAALARKCTRDLMSIYVHFRTYMNE